MQPSRLTAADLNAWRRSRGLYVRELAFVMGVPISTLKDKLYGRTPIRLDTDRVIDLVDGWLRRGMPPPGWPMRLNRQVHQNVIPAYDPHFARSSELHSPRD